MDDTDRKLLILIGVNPRIHYRELAKRLGISRQAVHHRMRVLTEIGVIKGITAGISVSYLNAVPVSVFGRSRTASIEKTLDRLAESELTRRAVVAGGNFLYVVGFLRDMSELDGYVEFVKRAAEIPEPTVGINNLDPDLMPYSVDGSGTRKESYKELTPLDLKIIASLKDNARRPVTEIAESLGVSAKTVRHHLEDMMSEGSLDIHVPVDLTSGGDLFLIMHVALREGTDRREFGRRLLSEYPFTDAYVRTFSNLPSFLVWVFWWDKIGDIRSALREVGRDEDVKGAMLNFAFLERIYPTWRDILPAAKLAASRRPRAHDLRFGHGTR